MIKIGNLTLFKKSHDGGKDSGVTGYWLIEWKSVFSIVLLNFKPNNRENFHDHAFNALTWWVKGCAKEICYNPVKFYTEYNLWFPSFIPKFTPRSNVHKIIVDKSVWAISIRGPWKKEWHEYNKKENKLITLTNGRKVVCETWI